MKLLINNIEVDSITDNDIAITKSVNDMMSLGSREGAFSTEIEAGLSKNNRLLTSNAQATNSVTSFPYKNNRATLEIAGETILVGFAELTETSQNYKINCFSELSDISDLIGDGNLSELNLDYANGSPINHIWDYATVIANRNNTWADGFIYPNLNYGKWDTSTLNAYWNDLYPSIFCKYLFLRIFHSIGYAVTGEFLTNELFESSILPMVKIPETPQFYLDANKSKAINPSNRIYYNANYEDIVFSSFPINNGFQFSSGYQGQTRLSPSIYGNFTMNLTFNLTLSTSNTATLNLGTIDNGKVYFETHSLSSGANSFSFNLSKKSASTQFFFTISQTQPFGNINISNLIWENIYDSQKLIENNQVFVSECLPEVSKKDFLITIINQYNLMIKVDSTSNTIDFSYFNSVAANKANAIDLSELLDCASLPTINYKLDGYAQNNSLNYETDEADIELRKVVNYGQGVLNCNNSTLEKTKEIFKSKFAPIVRTQVFSSKVFGYIQLWITEENKLRTQNIKPRIAYLQPEADSYLTIYGNELSSHGYSDASQSKGVYFEEMQFSSGLIPSYYSIVASMLLNTILLKANFKIRLKNFKEIDFTKPILLINSIKGFGVIDGYYYCNKINQFKINRYESTEIELIKI